MIYYSKKQLKNVLCSKEKIDELIKNYMRNEKIKDIINQAQKFKIEFYFESEHFIVRINNLCFELKILCYRFLEFYSWYDNINMLIEKIIEKIINLDHNVKVKLIEKIEKRICLKVKPL